MLTALREFIFQKQSDTEIIAFLLPRLVNRFQSEFSCFADCGGGVGNVTMQLDGILANNLSENAMAAAKIVSYEPLPENLSELRKRVGSVENIEVRPVAVGEQNGTAHFVVPNRMTGGSDNWGTGTSPNGYIGSDSNRESIPVEVVRLEDEVYDFDYLKFDLQGGEQKAIEGLGRKVRDAKLMYVEQQLLGGPEAPDPMELSILIDSGFICAYDGLQFGFIPQFGEVPVQLLAEGGIEITRIRPADGKGLPFMLFGRFRLGGETSLRADGSFDPNWIASVKKAGVPWMATDIVAINKDIYGEVMTLL